MREKQVTKSVLKSSKLHNFLANQSHSIIKFFEVFGRQLIHFEKRYSEFASSQRIRPVDSRNTAPLKTNHELMKLMK